ncbi:MAG: hypothetical protein KY467_04360 [Gemmatimonadetes bacterium]|nr:hypothetical protein [Gemmatimonadota bacterium]
MLRGLAVASVAGLVGVRWVYGGRWEGMDLLLSALIPIAIGASLLLMEPPEATAVRTRAGRRRGNWGVWFSEREARREFHWNVVAGWAFLLIGAVTLLASAL